MLVISVVGSKQGLMALKYNAVVTVAVMVVVLAVMVYGNLGK